MRGKELLLGVMTLPALVSCNPWQGWVYPDASNETISRSLSGFATFEQCQEAAIALLRSLPEPQKASYICGSRCRWDAEMQTNICKELRR